MKEREKRLKREERHERGMYVDMDEGSRGGKGQRLSSVSLSYLADNPPEGCMMVHKQSVNGWRRKRAGER